APAAKQTGRRPPPPPPPHEQRLSLRARKVKKLGDHRAKGAAGHDNRTFGSEWSTGADGDRGRQRLEERNLWLHAAAIDQNGLDGFRYSVASNALRTVSRHDPDDQGTGDGDENAVDTQVVADRRNHRRAPSAEIK